MKLLVFGGTAWLGRIVAAAAVTDGHEVTCFARGVGAPEGSRFIRGDRDRDDGLSAVAGEHWDAVVDVSRQPGQVRRAVRDLRAHVDRYVFVSTASVYSSQREIGQDEDAGRLDPLPGDVMTSMDDYGAAKVACEDAVLDGFGAARAVIARAGLIGGPGDASGRTGYWPWRFARATITGSPVLVPDARELPTAMIDVRDLAAWLVAVAGRGPGGVFNATGTPVPFPEYLDEVRRAVGHDGPVVPAPGAWLADRGVQEWSGPKSMPLWLADRSWYGMNARANQRAIASGLTLRPTAETIADTAEWERVRDEGEPHGAGLSDLDERDLLRELAGSR